MKRLENRICVITGAGRGIEEAIARHFANEGATVKVTDKDLPSAKDMAATIGGEARLLDVAQEDHWDTLANEFPQIDVLVNNAGVTGFEGGMVAHNPENARLNDWRNVHRINLDGTFLGCRSAIRAMRKKRPERL